MANKFSTKKNEGVTASSLFALDSKSGHSKIYDELCDIVDRVSYSGVLNAEDATDEYPDAVDVEFEVTSEDSAPYSVMVYIYGKEENDEESQLSYSVHDEYNNNLKDYISAVQGAPLGYQKGYKISELSQMWDDIEKDIQTLVSNADTDESKQKEAKKHTCSMQKKKESLAKKSEATYNPDKVKADEMRLDYLSGVDDFYDGVKKYGFDLKDRGYWGSGKDGVYYRTIWLTNGKRKSGPNTNHTIKIGYDTNENTPFVAIDQYVLGNVQDLLTVIADNFAPKTMESLAKKSEDTKVGRFTIIPKDTSKKQAGIENYQTRLGEMGFKSNLHNNGDYTHDYVKEIGKIPGATVYVGTIDNFQKNTQEYQYEAELYMENEKGIRSNIEYMPFAITDISDGTQRKMYFNRLNALIKKGTDFVNNYDSSESRKKSEANLDDLKGMVVSEGTMGVNALIRKYLAVLETYAPDNYKAYIEANPELKDREVWMALDVEDKSYIVDELADELNKIAPEGYYFGASEGDGACYGFWEVNPSESKKQEADGEDSQATYEVCFDYVQTMCKSVKANSVEDAVEKARQTISKDMQVCEIWCNEKTLPNGTKVYLDGKDSDEQSYTEGGWGVV